MEGLLVLTILSIPLYGNAIFRLTMQGEGNLYYFLQDRENMGLYKNMSKCTYYFYVGVGLQRKNNSQIICFISDYVYLEEKITFIFEVNLTHISNQKKQFPPRILFTCIDNFFLLLSAKDFLQFLK